MHDFMQNNKNEREKGERKFRDLIQPILPIAILYCNDQGSTGADPNTIKEIFEGSHAEKFQSLDEEIPGLEFVGHLSSFSNRYNLTDVDDVVVVFNAQESGFDVIAVMHYFDHVYYVTTVEQASTLNKLHFFVEEQISMSIYADQLKDKAWEIYGEFEGELSKKGITSELISNDMSVVSDFSNRSDCITNALVDIVDSIRR